MAISDEELARRQQISVAQVQLLRTSRGATNDTLAGLPQPAVQRALRRLNYPDLPRARQEFRAEQARNDDGRIPPNAIATALDELRRMRTPTRGRAGQPRVAGLPTEGAVVPRALIGAPALLRPTAGLAQNQWEWLGPGNIGGRTRSIVIHPTQPQLIWAGSVGGGVWHTTDGGGQWEPVDDYMANLAVSCLVMDPKHPNIIYAGTGEGFFNLDAIRGAGIFHTTDGEHWTQLSATVTADFTQVNRLAISRSSTVLLAATGAGLLRSSDAARATWTKVLDTPVADVVFHPHLSGRAVAGGLDNGEAYYSTNGGRTWKAASHGPWSGRVELAYAVADPSIVYASVQATNGEIWRSTDGGKTYQRRATLDTNGDPAPYLGDQGWYDNAIWCGDPTNADLVIVGGVDLWRSADGGQSLAEISTWWHPQSVHADHHAIVSHPGYNGTTNRSVYFGNDGGIFTATDILHVGTETQPPYTDGWTELVNNYGVTQLYGGAGHAGSGKIVCGAQDNGTICYDPGSGTEAWTSIFGGDGGWCAADPTDPNVFYGEYVYLNIHRNTDGGTSDDTEGNRYISGQFWNAAIGEFAWKPPPFRISDAMNRRALFIAPFALDPNDPNRLLAGGASLWRTNNAKAPNTNTSGPTWSAIKTSVGANISALAITAGDPDRVWVGHINGMVFRSTNATATTPTWQRMDHSGAQPLQPQRYCTCITIDPTDHDVVYVAFGGYASDNLWVTDDAGASWRNLAGPLPAAPIRAIAIHPRRRRLIYIGTEVGVFASEDAGASWSPTNEGPTNCSVDDLFWLGETLISATHGRGVFRIDLSGV